MAEPSHCRQLVLHPEDMHQADDRDLEAIIDLLEESAAWMISIGIDRWRPGTFIATRDQLTLELEAGIVYVWKVEGQVLGTLRLTEHDVSIWGNDGVPALYVHKMSVRRTLRGRGSGRALVQWVEKEAMARRRDVLRLDCWAENPRLCAFYESCGFKPIRTVTVKGWLHQLFEKEAHPVTARLN